MYYIYLFIILFICGGGGLHSASVEVRDDLQELVLSFSCMGPGKEFMSSLLVAKTLLTDSSHHPHSFKLLK